MVFLLLPDGFPQNVYAKYILRNDYLRSSQMLLVTTLHDSNHAGSWLERSGKWLELL